MSRARRLIVLLVLLGAAGGAAWYYLMARGAAGQSRLEAWCGRQLQAIADDHLRPRLSFDTLNLGLPATLTLSGVRLTDEGQTIISIDTLRLTLADLPVVGRPIQIARAEFDGPVVRLIPGPGGLLGLSDAVKPGAGRRLPDGGSTQLTDVLRIHDISVRQGSVQYEPPGGSAMRLQPLTFDLHSDAAGDGPLLADGWYAFQAGAMLEPVVRVDVAGRLNVNTGELDLSPLSLHTQLTEAQYAVFTPEIQAVLRRHQLTGTLESQVSGRIPLADTSGTDLEWTVQLRDARAVFAGREIPVQSLHLPGSYRGRTLALPAIVAGVFGGTATGSATVSFGEPGAPFELQAQGQDLLVHDLMQYAADTDEHTGILQFELQASGQARDLRGSLTGGGKASVDHARLAIVSLMSDLFRAHENRPATDKADTVFEIDGTHLHHQSLNILGRVIAITGTGDVYYDGRLDLLVNAGPVERLNAALGPLGDLLGKLTGAFVKYQVTGMLNDPKVKVCPLGIGAE